MRRVYLHAMRVKNLWNVQYLETDLGTPARRGHTTYTSLDRVREILDRPNASAEASKTDWKG